MGKIYACSDIHGQYEKYMKLWDIVTDEDELYIIGDVIDRGPDGMRILLDVMERKNVTFLLGNHECMMYSALFWKGDFSSGDLDYSTIYDPTQWFDIWTRDNNGGVETYRDYRNNYEDRGEDIADFLRNCPVMTEINLGEKRFVLSHATPDMDRIGEKAGDRLLCSGGVDSLVWDNPFEILTKAASAALMEGRALEWEDRVSFPLMDMTSVPEYMKPPFEKWEAGVTYIVGHVIVQRYGCSKMIHFPMYEKKDDVEKKVDFFDIDGGLAAYRHRGGGGLLDSLSLILYSLSDDKAIYL
jgi:hypothetical protein